MRQSGFYFIILLKHYIECMPLWGKILYTNKCRKQKHHKTDVSSTSTARQIYMTKQGRAVEDRNVITVNLFIFKTNNKNNSQEDKKKKFTDVHYSIFVQIQSSFRSAPYTLQE